MNIIVTGCSQGIGYEIVRYLIRSGNHKIIGVSRNTKPLKELEKKGEKSFFKSIEYDINQLNMNYEVFIEEIKNYCESIDILINNAGLLIKKDFQDFTSDDILRIFNTNLFSPARLIKLLLPLMMKKANKAHIVNIGSMGGFQGSQKFPGLSWYSSSKAALANLTECLSLELGKYNIALNCLALGSVETPMLSIAFPDYKPQVKADSIAKFISDFALKGHEFFNGKIIPVALSNP